MGLAIEFSSRDTGIEAGLEWNTSEISASTSVFDITQNQSEELNYTVMSELAFGSSQNSASCSTVPTKESIIADALAAWEHEDFVPENTTSGKLTNEKTSTSKGRKRKHRKSTLPDESFLSEESENSINYSAIQSAALLPKVNQLFSSHSEGNLKYPAPTTSSLNNTSLNNDTNVINQTSIRLTQVTSNQGRAENNHMCQSSFSTSGSGGDISCTSESQVNSTYITSQNSSLVSDSLSNQTIGESDQPRISSTQQPAKKRTARKSTLPSLSEEGNKKILNVPPKEVKKKATKDATKTKSKGTQVNIKTKAQKNNADPKKTTGKKVIRKRQVNKKGQENNQHIDESIRENIVPENDLNVNLGDPPDYDIKSKEALLREKVEELLNMPSTSNAIPDNNNTIGTIDMNMNNTIGNDDLDQTGSEVLVSQRCSIEIIKDANSASKINIVLPPETNLRLSKKSLPSNKGKKSSLAAESNTPKQGKIKIKQEKPSPKTIDLTSEARSTKTKREKEDGKGKKRHPNKNETSKSGNKKHGKESPAPKGKKQTIACGYMSSDSSEESDESRDSSDYSSSSCSCSDCADYCNCSFCNGSTSCSCSSCSESSYESPRRRRRHR